MTDSRSPSDRSTGAESAARRAVGEARLVTDRKDLVQAVEALRLADVVGLDTEFVRERTYYPRPGLIQVSDGRQVWLLDPIALPEMPELGTVLADRDIVKVLHSVGEDLAVLEQVASQLPGPLFDTQVAAALLGYPLQLRYEHLVAECFGVELPGGKARNDWCRRPLPLELLEYAAQDVIWLPGLCRRLSGELVAAGRLDWLEEDCARLIRQAAGDSEAAPLVRVKGAGRLDNAALALLQALAEWREHQARERDLPRRFVLDDPALIELAVVAAERGADPAIATLPPRQQKRYRASLERVLDGVDLEGFERPAALDPLTPAQRERLKEMQQEIRTAAGELGIEPALIASRRELTRLLHGERPDWLDGWRGTVLGKRLPEASANMPPADGEPR